MTLFLYVPKTSDPWGDIVKVLSDTVKPDGVVKVFRTINDLSRNLRQPKKDLTIVVLLPADREDILDAYNIQHLFRDTRVILVIPDLNKETIALAHRLRPRYLSYVHGNLPAIERVIDNMREGYVHFS